MPGFNNGETRIANGAIAPCRFVKVDSSIANGVIQALANDPVCGISQEGLEEFPHTGGSTNAASQGDALQVFVNGDVCLLELGAGGVTAGGGLKSDASGKGVAVATTGTTKQSFGAVALETGVAGEKVRVRVNCHEDFVALT